MESLILVLVLALLVFPLWAIIRIISLGRQNNAIAQKLADLERELVLLRDTRSRHAASVPAQAANAPTPAAAAATATVAETPKTVGATPPRTSASLAEEPAASSAAGLGDDRSAVPPIPPQPHPSVVPAAAASAANAATESPKSQTSSPSVPPPIAAAAQRAASITPRSLPPEPTEPPLFARINWEQFMGVKLFAWLGGFAAFLGAAFFIKYSFEHNWIPPEVRVAAGFLFGIGLVIGGLKIGQARYAVTAQTLIATGIVTLYAVTFACNSIYHFAFFGPVATFVVMTLITASAFLLAVRLEARVIAILGILGGFLTPVLLSTGHDNPGGLFGYLALLDAGLIAVALHRRWHFLVPLGAGGTVVMQVAWAEKFFTDEKAIVPVIVTVGFAALFLGACAVARRRGGGSNHLLWSAAALACVCFGFALYFNSFAALRNQPALLFTLALLADACLFALAWIERRAGLVAIAAGGAALVELAWVAETLAPAKAPMIVGISLGFCAVFLAAYFVARWITRRHSNVSPAGAIPEPGSVPREIAWSAAAMPLVAFGFTFAFLNVPAIAARPGLVLSHALLADLCLLLLAWFDEKMPKLHLGAGVAVFAILAAWTGTALTTPLLPWALAFYLLYAGLHTVFPLLLERHRPTAAPTWWSQLFPPLTLVLLLVPMFKLDVVSLALWPCILLVDLLAVAAAVFTGSLAAVAVVLLLTLGSTGVWIFRLPVALAPAPELLLIIGFFALFFFAAAMVLGRKLRPLSDAGDQHLQTLFGDTRAQLPAFSALLPFILLVMITQRLALANPSPVFGLALLLVVLTLGLASLMTLEWLPACALVGVAALEYAWHARHFAPGSAEVALGWYLGFYVVFSAFPFVFRGRFAALTGPWVISALAGVLQFPLVYRLIQQTWPNDYLGALPAAFAVIPLLSLVVVLRTPDVPPRARLNQLACFGGVALLFITLIFPIQFERQWLTLAWALEGAALLWLFHRVPHRGLQGTGVVLLVVAVVRLALNPAVLEYHARSFAPLLNWYLYSYGIVTAALFAGARLARSPRHQIFGLNVPPLLNTLATVLAFLLLNIEIADYFSAPGSPVLTFQFSGNFARDMTYTIAWSVFALALLLVSMWRQLRPGRYAALALLSVALLKLFLHDLARLDSLYRIGALFAVAVVAIIASFAYQRFLPGNDKTTPPQP